jgi:DNA-directed RNA polymerase beta subunit
MACSIFMGPTYYQRLKHLVADKVHSRAAGGPVVLLTKQPAEGRSREGGLRLGDMELDALTAHGIIGMQIERLLKCSDIYSISICKQCGRPAQKTCAVCDNNTDFATGVLPYCFKLLCDELNAMGISTRFVTAP